MLLFGNSRTLKCSGFKTEFIVERNLGKRIGLKI